MYVCMDGWMYVSIWFLCAFSGFGAVGVLFCFECV